MSCRGTMTAAPWDFQVRSLCFFVFFFLSSKATAKVCVTFVLVPICSRKYGSLNALIHLFIFKKAGLSVGCPAFVCAACCFPSLSLLSFHRCFASTHLQAGELNAILQDIAKSRQNIQQSLSGVSTVLPPTRPLPIPPVAAALWTLMFRCLPWSRGKKLPKWEAPDSKFCPAPRLVFSATRPVACMWACMLRFLVLIHLMLLHLSSSFQC